MAMMINSSQTISPSIDFRIANLHFLQFNPRGLRSVVELKYITSPYESFLTGPNWPGEAP